MRSLPFLLSSLALATAACGGDDSATPFTPTIIPGGGVHDPGIDGTVAVYVVDGDSDAPVAGALVAVGGVEIATDATGLASFDGVTGPQTITIAAPGYATTMWVGVDGANVTVPIDRTPAPTTPPDQALLSGTISGWSALPPPDPQHGRYAFISYSQDPILGSRANDIMQPPAMGLPASSCSRLPGTSTPCNWRLNARAGTIALGVIVIDVDNRGTGDPNDDAPVVTGYSVTPITVEAGRNQSGLMLNAVPADSGVRPVVDLGTPPPGLTQTAVAISLDLGAAGVLRYGRIDPTRAGAIVPSLALAPGATWEMIAVASEPVADGTAARSIVLRRGLTDPSAFTAGAWLPPPTGLATDRTMVSFTRSRTESPYLVEFFDQALGVEGRKLMTIVILDASSQVALPTRFAPLVADPLTMTVTTLDAGVIDLRDFEADQLSADAVGFATETIAVP